jgi:hypothetical protein
VHSDDVDALAEAVSDGQSIDWDAAHARLASDSDRTVAGSLRTLSRLTTTPAGAAAPADRRLPALIALARLVAILCVRVSLPGYYLLLRGAQPIRFGIFLGMVMIFAGTATYLDIGGTDRRARSLGAFLWMSAGSFSARGTYALAQRWPGVALVGFVLALRPEAFFAAGLWQFARDFPALTRFSRFDRWSLAGLRVGLAVGAALFILNLLPVFAGPAAHLTTLASPFQRLVGDGQLFWLAVFGVSIPALAVMAARARAATGTERARVRLFLVFVTVAFTPVVVQVFLESLFPDYLRLMRAPLPAFLWSVAIYAPNFLFPLATAYAVSADNVLGVRVVVHRGLRYLLTRWSVTMLAALPLAALAAHLYEHASQPLALTLAEPRARTLLWLAAAGLGVLSCRWLLVTVLDRWAMPDAQDGPAMLAQMTERFKLARTPLEVASALARAVARALQAPSRAYLSMEDVLVPVDAGAEPTRPPSVVRVLLEGACEPCFVSGRHRQSYYPLMTRTDQQWVDREGIEVLVPVLSGRKGRSLLAVVAVNGRGNALAFSRDDVRLLRAAAASASLACDALAADADARYAGAAAPEEVGAQCTRCRRVEAWASDSGLCECGAAREPSALPKRLLARYEISRRLGAGGMGVVYHAIDLTLGRGVAVKTLTRLSEGAADRLMTEARTMAGLGHAHLAVLYGAERWRGTPLLVMEYLAGGTLADRLRKGPLAPADAIRILRQLASALEYVHGTGLYHGDIKPSNIGFTADGVPKFLDFGLSRAIAAAGDAPENGHQSQAIGGTPAYLSPEVRGGAAPGPALDLWALNVVLCESLLGSHPFPAARSDGDFERGADAALAQVRQRPARAVCRLLASSLAVDPRRRPQGAGALWHELDLLMQYTAAPGAQRGVIHEEER